VKKFRHSFLLQNATIWKLKQGKTTSLYQESCGVRGGRKQKWERLFCTCVWACL